MGDDVPWRVPVGRRVLSCWSSEEKERFTVMYVARASGEIFHVVASGTLGGGKNMSEEKFMNVSWGLRRLVEEIFSDLSKASRS